MFRASFQMPFNWGRAVWSWQRLKQPKLVLQKPPFECKKPPVRFLPPWLRNPSVASIFRKVPSGEGTDPHGSQSTGIPAAESEQVYAAQEAASAISRDQGRERQNPMPQGRISPTKTIPAIQHWTIIFELNLTYI